MSRFWIFIVGTLAGASVVAVVFGLLRPVPTKDPLDPPAKEGVPKQVARQLLFAETEIRAESAHGPVLDSKEQKPELSVATPPVPSSPKTTEASEPNTKWRTLVSDTIEDALKPDRSAEWDALVSGMLEYEVERRFGRRLDLVQQRRLLDRLAQLRHASLGLQQEPADPGSPAALRARLSRTLAILQADRAFREELGIGVAHFLQDLDADAVEDVAPPRTSR